MAADRLAPILARKRDHVAARKVVRPAASLLADAPPPLRGFARALAARRAQGAMALVAELKKASPSAGLIRDDFDVPALAPGDVFKGGIYVAGIEPSALLSQLQGTGNFLNQQLSQLPGSAGTLRNRQ